MSRAAHLISPNGISPHCEIPRWFPFEDRLCGLLRTVWWWTFRHWRHLNELGNYFWNWLIVWSILVYSRTRLWPQEKLQIWIFNYRSRLTFHFCLESDQLTSVQQRVPIHSLKFCWSLLNWPNDPCMSFFFFLSFFGSSWQSLLGLGDLVTSQSTSLFFGCFGLYWRVIQSGFIQTTPQGWFISIVKEEPEFFLQKKR